MNMVKKISLLLAHIVVIFAASRIIYIELMSTDGQRSLVAIVLSMIVCFAFLLSLFYSLKFFNRPADGPMRIEMNDSWMIKLGKLIVVIVGTAYFVVGVVGIAMLYGVAIAAGIAFLTITPFLNFNFKKSEVK